MPESIRCKLMEANFDPEDGQGLDITLKIWDSTQRMRAGNYLLIPADDDWQPEPSQSETVKSRDSYSV